MEQHSRVQAAPPSSRHPGAAQPLCAGSLVSLEAVLLFLALFPPRGSPRTRCTRGREQHRGRAGLPAGRQRCALGTSCLHTGDSVRSWGGRGGCPGPVGVGAGRGQGMDCALHGERDEGCSEAAQRGWVLLPRPCCERVGGRGRGWDLGDAATLQPTGLAGPGAGGWQGAGAGQAAAPKASLLWWGHSWAQPVRCWLR